MLSNFHYQLNYGVQCVIDRRTTSSERARSKHSVDVGGAAAVLRGAQLTPAHETSRKAELRAVRVDAAAAPPLTMALSAALVDDTHLASAGETAAITPLTTW